MIIQHSLTTALNITSNEPFVNGQPRLKQLKNMTSKHGTVFTVTQVKYPLSNGVGYRVLSPTGKMIFTQSLKEAKNYINRGA